MFNDHLKKEIKELKSLVAYQDNLLFEQGELCEKLVKWLQNETFQLSKEIEKKNRLKNKPIELIRMLEHTRDHNRMICNRVAENEFKAKG